MLPRRKADGGEVNEWDAIPRTPEGRPQITVTKPSSPYKAVSGAFGMVNDWLQRPAPIKPETPQPTDFQEPSQAIGEGVRGLGSGYLQSLKDMASPFVKEEDQSAYREQEIAPSASRDGKIPENQKDSVSFGAPIAAEVASTFAGKPGAGLGWGLLKSAGLGFAGAAAKKAVPKAAAAFDFGFLDTSKFKPVSGSKGTMEGGFRVDPSGQEWYVKQAPNLEHAKNEKLTAELYKLFGVPVAEVHLTTVNGKPGIASKKIEGDQLGNSSYAGWYHHVDGLHENYPVHALLANHDAVGTGPENPLGNIIVDAAGKAHVIDTGGGLLYKGTGSKKAKFSPEIVEIDTMADPNYSHLSAEVFGNADYEVGRVGAQRIADVDEMVISRLVETYGPADKMEKLNLLSTLLKRKQNIQDHYGVQPKKSSTQQVLAQALGTNEPKPAPKAPDPYEQIPFTEDDYAKWADEIPPEIVPDDVMNHGRLPTMADPVKMLVVNHLIGQDMAGKMLDGTLPKADLAIIGKKLTKHQSNLESAHYLWTIAQEANPQLAEAIFRNLPPSIQPGVGHAIYALKEKLGFSPWNSVAKGSGMDGKYPLAYDYYSTKTDSFVTPKHVAGSKYFQSELEKLANTIENKGLPEQVATKGEYSGIPAGYANSWLNAPKEAFKLMEHFKTGPNGMVQDYDIKGIAGEIAKLGKDYPEYADKVYLKLPSHLKSAVLPEYGNAKEALKKLKITEEAEKVKSGKFDFMEGRTKALYEKNSPIGKAFAGQFLEPIKDWQAWKPASKVTSPSFSSPAQKNLAESRGFNTQFEIHKGGEFPNPHWADEKYPLEIPDPSSKHSEPAWFGSDQSYIASQYGNHTGGTYIVGSKKAFEVDWHKYTGEEGWNLVPMHNLIVSARERGADLIVIHGMNDMGGANQTQYAVINPAILRAPHAKFEKSKLHKSWPLAGLSGGGLYTYGALQEKDEMNRGGIPGLVYRAKALARGGPGSAPWAVRNRSHPRHKAGMIKSSIPGRTDKIPMSVPPGSYILPADVPSALGEGNTMAGEKILGAMFNSGPYSQGARSFAGKKAGRFADGGTAEQTENEDIPIIAAGGEYVIHPEQVAAIGNGDMKAGHKVLDKFVLSVRKKNIDTLKKLKPPKK